MHTIIVVVHMFVCIGLIGFVLIQHGKGADAGAAFGSGASSTVFGSRGSASFLTRTTAILATIFFVTSLTLAYFSGQKESKSVVEEEIPPAKVETTIPLPKEETVPSELPPSETVSTPETPTTVKEAVPPANGDAPAEKTTTENNANTTEQVTPAPADTERTLP